MAKNCTGRPSRCTGRLCQVRNAASRGLNAPKIPNGSAPRAVVGMLPQCQAVSFSVMNRPPSASNSSTYACPSGFGEGLETAISPATLRNDGASVWTPGRASTARVSQPGWKLSRVESPPMKIADGSRPNGGRVKALCSR